MMYENFDVQSTSKVSVGNEVVSLSRFTKSPKHNMEVVNTTGRPVTVIMRNGMKYTIPTAHLGVSRGVRFSHTVELPDIYFRQAKEQLETECDVLSVEQRAIMDCIKGNLFQRNHEGCYVARIDYIVTDRELENASNASVYLADMDVVITYNPAHRAPVHPFSLEGIREDLHVRTMSNTYLNAAGFMITIVDNHGQLGDRWTLFKDSLFHIEAQVNPILEDGIYLTRHGVWARNGATSTDERFELENWDKLPIPLFENKQDAIDSSTRVKEMASELEQLKINSGLRAEELKTERLDRDAKYAALEAERKELQEALSKEKAQVEHFRTMQELGMKHKNEQRKDYYEERSQERKDTGDAIKLGLTILTLGVGLMSLLKK